MLRSLLLCAFLVLCIVACSHVNKGLMAAKGNPNQVDASLLALGESVFQRECVRCHGPDGAGDGLDASELETELPDFSDGSYSKSVGLSAANIKYGKHEDMPAFENLLSEREIWAVAVYVSRL